MLVALLAATCGHEAVAAVSISNNGMAYSSRGVGSSVRVTKTASVAALRHARPVMRLPTEPQAVAPPQLPSPPLLYATAFLQSSCFGMISQALPAALMRQAGAAGTVVAAASTLGKLMSAASLAELCLAGTLGQVKSTS